MRYEVPVRLLSVIICASALAACGGSSKPKSQPPPASNQPPATIGYNGPTTSATASQASGATLLTSVFKGTSGFSSTAGGPSPAAVVSGSPRFGVKDAMGLVAARRGSAGVLAAGAVSTNTQPCTTSGTMTVETLHQSASPVVTTVGDYETDTFQTCVEGTMTLYGSIRMEVVATDGANFVSGNYADYTSGSVYKTAVTLSSFSIADTATGSWFGMNGQINVDETVNHTIGSYVSVSRGPGVTMASGTRGTVSESFSVGPITGTTAFVEGYQEAWAPTDPLKVPYVSGFNSSSRICSTAMQGCVDVTTPIDFSQNVADLYPYQGELKVTVDTGAYFDLAVVDATGNVDVSYDLKNGLGLKGPYRTTWTCLNGANSSACYP